MFDGKPKISVIIPTYDRAHVIGRSIQSVMDQTYQDFEIIVVDDASTDNTENIIKSCENQKIVYIQHTRNEGAGAARNTGIMAARGEYIAFQDSDDEWFPEKLETQINVFRSISHEVGMIYTDMLRINENGEIKYFDSPAVTDGNLINTKTLDYQVMNIGIQSTLIRKECFDRVGFFDERFPRFIDLDFFIRLSKHYQFYHIKKPLVKYYATEGISSNLNALITARILLLEKHFEDVKHDKRFLSNQYFDIGYMLLLNKNESESRFYFMKSFKFNPFNVKIVVTNLISLFSPNLNIKVSKTYIKFKTVVKNAFPKSYNHSS